MMSKARGRTATQTQRVKDSTTTKKTGLTALEEKVVRMRYGYTAPTDHVLEQVGQDHPETAAQLAAMEQRLLEAVGPRVGPTKRKIVSALRRKH